MTKIDRRNLPIEDVDVIVLGAGPAGINCALELNEYKIEALVVDRNSLPGGQLPDIPSFIPNLSSGTAENGKAVQKSLCDAVIAAKLKVVLNESVQHCDLGKLQFQTANHVYQCKTAFLATGYRVRRLPHEENYSRFSKEIFYNTGATPHEFDGKTVAVIGGGDSALLEALERAATAERVYIINRSDSFKARRHVMNDVKANERIQVLTNQVLHDLIGDNCLKQIELRSTTDDTTQQLDVDKLIVKIGYAPNTEIFAGQIDMDSSGHIRVEPDCRTSVNAVFAGGDIVTPGFDRIANAMGNGIVAARSIRMYLESLSN